MSDRAEPMSDIPENATPLRAVFLQADSAPASKADTAFVIDVMNDIEHTHDRSISRMRTVVRWIAGLAAFGIIALLAPALAALREVSLQWGATSSPLGMVLAQPGAIAMLALGLTAFTAVFLVTRTN